MILDKKIIRLPDAENIAFYPISSSQILLYIKNNIIKSKVLSLLQIARCQPLKTEYDCEEIIRISDDMVCLCHSNNMSLKKQKKEI